MSDYLYLVKYEFDLRIHSFVLLDNHFHMVVTTPQANLSEAMNYFMRETSKEINRCTGGENQVYGSRYYRTLVSNPYYVDHVYKYVYRNPVHAGLAKYCEEYKYSTLHGLLGLDRLVVPVEFDPYLFERENSLESTLAWINRAPTQENYECLSYRLTKNELTFPKNRKNKKGHFLEAGIY